MTIDIRFLGLLFFAFLMLSQNGLAQKYSENVDLLTRKERYVRADSCLAELQRSVLIVRLPAFREKIDKLERIEQNHASKRQRRIAKRRKNRQIRDRDYIKTTIIDGMYQYYTFSDFLITTDSAWKALLGGQNQNIFFNEKKEIDSTIKLEGKTYLMMRYGKTNYATTANRTGFIIADFEQKDLESPFPYYFDVYHPGRTFLYLLFPKMHPYNDLSFMIQVLNKELSYAVDNTSWRVQKWNYKKVRKAAKRKAQKKE